MILLLRFEPRAVLFQHGKLPPDLSFRLSPTHAGFDRVLAPSPDVVSASDALNTVVLVSHG
jgi:hypothetical protein